MSTEHADVYAWVDPFRMLEIVQAQHASAVSMRGYWAADRIQNERAGEARRVEVAIASERFSQASREIKHAEAILAGGLS